MELDIVYVVREAEVNDNLRLSLRSLVNLPHGRIFIAGFTPSWLTNVVSVPRDQSNQANQENSNLNLLEACKRSDLSDDFIFMNDDFFIMRPIEKVPGLRMGSLDDVIARYKSGNRMGQAFSLIATRAELRKIVPYYELYSYELHMPMVLNKDKVLAMFNQWTRPVLSLRPRTFYGNVYSVRGEQTDDAKEIAKTDQPFTSAAYGEPGSELGQLIRQRFTTPSIYESPAA